MNPTLRVLWLAVGWSGALVLLALGLQIAVMGMPGTRRQFTWVLMNLLLIGILLGVRFVRLAKAGVWRWLPDGRRTLTLAQTIASFAGLLLLAGIIGRAMMRGTLQLPLSALWWLAAMVIAALVCWGIWRSSARVAFGVLLSSTPAARILESNRSWIVLPIALLTTFCVPLIFQHLFSIHARDTFTAVAGGAAGFVAVAMMLIAAGAARRARLLWMLRGDSRAEVMKECERALLVVLAVLVACAWLAPTVVSLGLTGRLNLDRSAWLVPALLVAAIGPMYVGLAWPTFASWWRNMPTGHIVLLAILLLPLIWRFAYAIVQPLALTPRFAPILYGALAAAALRAFASWRWRRIDWTYLNRDND